jgi:hypothetical protein
MSDKYFAAGEGAEVIGRGSCDRGKEQIRRYRARPRTRNCSCIRTARASRDSSGPLLMARADAVAMEPPSVQCGASRTRRRAMESMSGGARAESTGPHHNYAVQRGPGFEYTSGGYAVTGEGCL